MTKIHKMILNLYSTISLSNIINAFMVTLHSNIKKRKKKKKKKKGKGKMVKERISTPSRDRTWVACMIYQQDNTLLIRLVYASVLIMGD